MRREWVAIICSIVPLALISAVICWKAYESSLVVKPLPPCRTQWGQNRPQEFCDRRDRERSDKSGGV